MARVNYIKAYLEYKGEKMPSFDDFEIYAIEKNWNLKQDNLGEYKGLLNKYSRAWLNNKISTGARNTMALVPLLKQFEHKEDSISNERVIVNFNLENKSKNKIKKVK